MTTDRHVSLRVAEVEAVEHDVATSDTVELLPATRRDFEEFQAETRAELISIDQHLNDLRTRLNRRDKVVVELQLEGRRQHKTEMAKLARIEKKNDELLGLIRTLVEKK